MIKHTSSLGIFETWLSCNSLGYKMATVHDLNDLCCLRGTQVPLREPVYYPGLGTIFLIPQERWWEPHNSQTSPYFTFPYGFVYGSSPRPSSGATMRESLVILVGRGPVPAAACVKHPLSLALDLDILGGLFLEVLGSVSFIPDHPTAPSRLRGTVFLATSMMPVL